MLLVGADFKFVEMLKEFISEDGFSPIRTSSSLEEAVQELPTFEPDVVAVDTFGLVGEMRALLGFAEAAGRLMPKTNVYLLWNYLDDELAALTEVSGATSLAKGDGLSAMETRWLTDLGRQPDTPDRSGAPAAPHSQPATVARDLPQPATDSQHVSAATSVPDASYSRARPALEPDDLKDPNMDPDFGWWKIILFVVVGGVIWNLIFGTGCMPGLPSSFGGC